GEVAVAGHRGDAYRGAAEAPEPGPGPRAGEPAGVAHVVDGRAENLPDRLETGAADRRELSRRQRRAPGPAVPDLGHPRPCRRGQTGFAATIGHARPPSVSSGAAFTIPACAGGARSPCPVPVLSRRFGRPTPRCGGARSPVPVPPPPWWGTARAGPWLGSLLRVRPCDAGGNTTSGVRCPCRLDSQTMATLLQPGRISPMRQVPANIPRPEYMGRPRPRTGEPDVKDAQTIERMRAAGKLAAQALAEVGRHVMPGVTTDELDRIGHEFLCDHNAYPSTLGYRGFPKSLCTSLNEVICHGIPDDTVIAEGDIVNVDITAFRNGVHGD